jgi:hypothetical protein
MMPMTDEVRPEVVARLAVLDLRRGLSGDDAELLASATPEERVAAGRALMERSAEHLQAGGYGIARVGSLTLRQVLSIAGAVGFLRRVWAFGPNQRLDLDHALMIADEREARWAAWLLRWGGWDGFEDAPEPPWEPPPGGTDA